MAYLFNSKEIINSNSHPSQNIREKTGTSMYVVWIKYPDRILSNKNYCQPGPILKARMLSQEKQSIANQSVSLGCIHLLSH